MFRFKRDSMRILKLNSVATICQVAFLALLLSGMLTQALSQEPDPRFEVAEYVHDNVLGGEYGDRTIWISSQPVDSSHEARSLDLEEPIMKIPYEGWMVMIDDAPRANWGHNVRWLIVRVDLGAHTTPQMYTFPPRVFDDEGNEIPVTCLEGATGVPCEPPDVESTEVEGLDMAIYSALTNQEKDCLYAVLISGGAYPHKNFERYRTNLRSMYTILLSQGYPKSNIFVYYADGASLDLDNADGDDDDSTGNDVTDDVDETTIRTRLQELCDDLNPVTDYLFVYVTDHGMTNGSICLWDFDGSAVLEANEQYSPAEMGNDTADCQVCRLFMLHDQCHSGAFLSLATDGDHDNTTVYAAATAAESSYGREYLDCWEDLDHGTTTLEDLHQYVVDNCFLRSTPGKNEVDETNDQVLLGDCCNTPPIADANGPYTEQCQGAQTILALDGTGSSDPDAADTLTYAWTTDCPGGAFDDDTSATPVLTVDTSTGCLVICNVFLTVTDLSGASDTSSATVTIQDTMTPVITCPPDLTIECDASTEPTNTGSATATDSCDSSPVVTFSDVTTPGTCPAEFTITRTWTATDYCGNTSSCVQTINVVDTTPPVISCNAPSTIIPPDAPISFTATATDNCDTYPSVEVIGFDCFKFTKKGKRIDKTESCAVEVAGDTVTILDSGGVGDHISWTVQATDDCENESVFECEVVVVNPAQP